MRPMAIRSRPMPKAKPEYLPESMPEASSFLTNSGMVVSGSTRPDVMEMLEELKNRGKNIAVVSNKFYAATREICRHFFGDLVDVAIGERENIKKKPAPDTVNEALRQLHADRERAVYIGDSDVDVMTAKNSGMPCISVLWGFRDHDFLLAHGASILVSSPLQIL